MGKRRRREPKKGFFRPKNPSKYKGDLNNIIFRSLLELRFMEYLDSHEEVLRWSSEENIIIYWDPTSGRHRRYFPDFWFQTKDKEYIVEIKPKSQTQPPKKTNRKSQRYLQEVLTWGVNSAKWEAAEAYCSRKGMTFKIITESDMGFGSGNK